MAVGVTKAQKRAARLQEEEKARAEAEKIRAIQGEIGTRTQELIRKYGTNAPAMAL
jgi:hypothetical protein